MASLVNSEAPISHRWLIILFLGAVIVSASTALASPVLGIALTVLTVGVICYVVWGTSLLLSAYVISVPAIAFAFNISSVSFGFQPSYLLGILLAGSVILANIKKKALYRLLWVKPNVYLTLFYIWVITLAIPLSMRIPTAALSHVSEQPLWPSIKQGLYLTACIFVYYGLTIVIKNRETLNRCVRLYVWASLFASLYGFYVMVAGQGYLPFYPVLNNNISYSLSLGFNTRGFTRMTGPTPEPSVFASMTISAMTMVFVQLVSRGHILRGWWYYVILAIDGLAFILTFSRVGYLALVLIVFLLLFFLNPRQLVKAMAVIVVSVALITIGILIFYPEAISGTLARLDSLLRFNDHSTMVRWSGIVGGLNTFLHYPITGVGYGNYGFYHHLYAPGSTALFQSTPFPLTNSLVTRLLSETGSVGTFFLALFALYMWRRVRWINKTANRQDRTMTLTLWGGVVSVVVALTVGTPDLTFMYSWLLLAMMVVQIRLMKRSLENGRGDV